MIEFDLQKILQELEKCSTMQELITANAKFLGANGKITAELKGLKNKTSDEKRIVGPKLNALRNAINQKFHEKKERLELIEDDDLYHDLTLPTRSQNHGSQHLLNKTMNELREIFGKLGFIEVDGQEIEDELHNFDYLNNDKLHPARQMQDTFYLQKDFNTDNKTLLRTHTSATQIHAMKTRKQPVAIISMGRVFRKDWDATHTPMFHQIEGFMIDKNISLANMKWCLENALKKFFDNSKLKTRFRMSYFPFTEPSCEIDISSDGGKNWMEILGCGMIHRNVLTNMGLNYREYQGFAFGMGIERLTMIKHGIKDLRSFFKINLTQPYYQKSFC